MSMTMLSQTQLMRQSVKRTRIPHRHRRYRHRYNQPPQQQQQQQQQQHPRTRICPSIMVLIANDFMNSSVNYFSIWT
jgi:hypothetical protein